MSEPAHHICDACEAHLYCEGANCQPCPGDNGERCKFYTLPFFGLADENATAEYDVELIFCDPNCANQWLGKNFNQMIRGIGAPIGSAGLGS